MSLLLFFCLFGLGFIHGGGQLETGKVVSHYMGVSEGLDFDVQEYVFMFIRELGLTAPCKGYL